MYPDQITLSNLIGYSLGEKTVGFFVCLLGGLVERHFTGVIMERRLKDGVYNK